MESVSPPVLNAIRATIWLMRSGRSMNESLRYYLETTNDSFASVLRERHLLLLKGHHSETPFTSIFQQTFWDLVVRAHHGQPILEALQALEHETTQAAQAELDDHISSLPFRVMIPLLLFMFPAYLIVLVGPLLRELSEGLGG